MANLWPTGSFGAAAGERGQKETSATTMIEALRMEVKGGGAIELGA